MITHHHLEQHINLIDQLPNSIAVFDLDGTLTSRDSFVAFLITFGLRHRRLKSLGTMFALITLYLMRCIADYRLKELLIKEFFGKVPTETVAKHSKWFASTWLPKHLHPVGLALLHQHRRNGNRIILVSASPDIYVKEIAEALKIQEVLCTEIQQNDGRWQGRIIGSNCKGPNKVAAIKDHLRDPVCNHKIFAYGDSQSDLPILRWADFGCIIERCKVRPIT